MSGYRYGFNGKENDNEVKGDGNQQDYGMRIYDPRVGRFLSVDPVGGEYPWNNSYAYAENDVVRSIDVDGAEKHVQTFAYGVSNGEPVVKLISNDYKQPEGTFNIYHALFGGPMTPEEVVADGFIRANHLPAGGTFSFFVFDSKLGKENYARYEYEDPGGKQQVRYFSSGYVDFMYEHFEKEKQQAAKILNIGSHVATLVGAGAVVKAELKGLSAELSAEAKLATGEASLNKNCFVAGTKILTNNGFKTIENIKVEDSVWAFNDVTRKKELKIVTALSKKEVKKLIRLSFENEVLYATPEHPFWINNTWVLAKNIQYGDSLTLFSNRKCAVAIKNELDTSALVYNFTVSEFHSYFVSSLGVLVHNTCFEPVKFTGKGAGRFNTEITEVAAGRGNQIFKADGSPEIFEGRTASNGKDWIGAFEYKVDPPEGVENIYRILKKQIGVNSAGEPIYKYGYSTDHYEGTIHSYKEIPSSSATAGGTGGAQ